MRLDLMKKSNFLLCTIYLVSQEKQQTSVFLNKSSKGRLCKYKLENRSLPKYSPGSDTLSPT